MSEGYGIGEAGIGEANNGSRVLVTGASGFVGGAVCRTLDEAGYRVRAAVRHDRPGFAESRVVGDIHSQTQWNEALEGVDCVVHLAARVHVMEESSKHPLREFRRTNVEGTERLAREAAAAGVRRMVYVSSVKVHGEMSEVSSISESAPLWPEDPYAISKLEAEQSLFRVASETGIEAVTLRPPLIYGPEVKANFLQLLKVANSGVPLPLGSVDNRRSFLYVDNLADAIRACIGSPGAAGEAFLVSDGEGVSTPELIRRLARALNRPSRLLPFPPRLLRVAGRVDGRSSTVARLLDSLEVDASKIRERLAWSPPYTLEEGLRETARWYRDG